jgi:hypothetical protein
MYASAHSCVLRSRFAIGGLVYISYIKDDYSWRTSSPRDAQAHFVLGVGFCARTARRLLWLFDMSNKKTLEINKLTIRKLTNDEADGAAGGIKGVVLNPTGGDTRGVKLSLQWYAAKWTIGGGK